MSVTNRAVSNSRFGIFIWDLANVPLNLANYRPGTLATAGSGVIAANGAAFSHRLQFNMERFEKAKNKRFHL